jgi:hypothetical protein
MPSPSVQVEIAAQASAADVAEQEDIASAQ